MANAVVHFEVAGKDLEALKSFYTEMFDWKTDDVEAMPYSIVEKQEGGIAGGLGQAPEGNPGHTTFYVSVDDIEAGLSKAEGLGGSRIMGPMDIGGGQIGLFTDPEGHVIGLWRGSGD